MEIKDITICFNLLEPQKNNMEKKNSYRKIYYATKLLIYKVYISNILLYLWLHPDGVKSRIKT